MNRSQFNVILVLSSLLFIACAWIPGYPNDMGIWRTWAVRLGSVGFSEFFANYPPVYMEWLWLVGKVFSLLKAPILNGFLFKLFLQLPVLAAHIAILKLVHKVSVESKDTLAARLSVLLFAFNPAVFFDGPIWGQTDLLPVALVLWSAHFAMRDDLRYSLPLFALALLTKLQAVLFLPVLLVIWFKNSKGWKEGLAFSIPTVAVISLPYMLFGSLALMYNKAYSIAATFFPVTSLNGASLWNLLAGNQMFYDIPLLGGTGERVSEFPALFLTVRFLSLLLYGSCMVWVLVLAIRTNRFNEERFWRLMLLSALAFFTLSAAMHERYLVFAVPCAAVWGVFGIRRTIWFGVISLLALLNIVLVFPFNHFESWKLLSFLVSAAFAVFVLDCFGWSERIKEAAESILSRRNIYPYAVIALVWLSLAAALMDQDRDRLQNGEIHIDNEHIVYLSNLLPSNSAMGRLQIDASVDGRPMHIGGFPFTRGLGAHAPFEIEYDIPAAATHFISRIGLDDEVPIGLVEFMIFLDGEPAWSSGPINADMESKECGVNVIGKSKLTLKVSTLGPDTCDHADWANARFYFGE